MRVREVDRMRGAERPERNERVSEREGGEEERESGAGRSRGRNGAIGAERRMAETSPLRTNSSMQMSSSIALRV